MITVTGRGLRQPIVSTSATELSATIRVDSDADPAYWLNVHISESSLRKLLDMIALVKAMPDGCDNDDEADDTTLYVELDNPGA